jgi:hypothetical protein
VDLSATGFQADRVQDNRESVLLEPINPFDRPLIHTTLNDIADVETKSEGEGLYKQVRVYYRGGMRQAARHGNPDFFLQIPVDGIRFLMQNRSSHV